MFHSLDPRRKYHVKILAVSQAGDGQETDQSATTPGCLCEPGFLLFIWNRSEKRSPFTLCVCLPSGQRPTGSIPSASPSCDRLSHQLVCSDSALERPSFVIQKVSPLHREVHTRGHPQRLGCPPPPSVSCKPRLGAVAIPSKGEKES